MENIELEKIGLLELNAQEQKEVDGGNALWMWAGACLAWDIISSPSAAGSAFSSGFNQWN